VGESEAGALGFHLGEELVFAVEAALGVVAAVVGLVELGGLEDVGGDAVFGGEGEGGGELGAGQRGGVGDDGEHAVAEGAVRPVGEEGGVGASGVGDKDGGMVKTFPQCGRALKGASFSSMRGSTLLIGVGFGLPGEVDGHGVA
jgi:hypothetical protein